MRGNITSKLNNTKPWDEIRVGPGLAPEYGTHGSGGFNSGMEAKLWQPKTVDQLRVDTNPKNTYRGQVLGAHVGRRGPRGQHGKVEKNRPDTFYIQQPDRWLTTTGAGGEARTRLKIFLKKLIMILQPNITILEEKLKLLGVYIKKVYIKTQQNNNLRGMIWEVLTHLIKRVLQIKIMVKMDIKHCLIIVHSQEKLKIWVVLSIVLLRH